MAVFYRRRSHRLQWATLLCPLLLLQPVMAVQLPAHLVNDGNMHDLPPTGPADRYQSVDIYNNSTLTLSNGAFNILELGQGSAGASFGNLILQNNAIVDVTRFREASSAPGQVSSLIITGGSSLTAGSELRLSPQDGTAFSIDISGQNSRLLALNISARLSTANIAVSDHGLLDLNSDRSDAQRGGRTARFHLAGADSRLTVTSGGQVVADQIMLLSGARAAVSGTGSTLDITEALRLNAGTATLSDGAELLVKQGTGSSGIPGIALYQNARLVAGGEGTLIRVGPANSAPPDPLNHHVEFSQENAEMYLGADAAAAAVAAPRLVLPQGSRGIVFLAAANGPTTQKLAFNHTATDASPYRFDANIEGNGIVENLAGSTTLSGRMDQFTGAIRATGGAFRLSSAAPQSAISVARDARLIIEPGLSFGDINMSPGANLHLLGGQGGHRINSLSLEDGSVMRLGLDSADDQPLISVSQVARLAHARLILEKGSAIETGHVYTLIQAGQLEGQFADAVQVQNLQGSSEAFAFLTPALSYATPNAVTVSFTRRAGEAAPPDPNAGQPTAVPEPPADALPVPPANPQPVPAPLPIPPANPQPAPAVLAVDELLKGDDAAPPKPPVVRFQDRATTANQIAVATALENQSDGHPLHRFVLALPASAPDTTFDALSGDALTAMDQGLRESAMQPVATVPLSRLRQQLLAARRPGAMLAASDGIWPASALPAAPANSLWLQPTGNWQQERSTKENPGVRAETGGLFLGGDHQFSSGWIAGAALGATQTSMTVHERHARATADNYSLTVYGGKTFALEAGDLNTQFGVGYTRHDIRSERDLRYVGLPQKLTSSHQSQTLQAFAEIGHTFSLTDNADIEPYIGIVVNRMHTPAYKESGGSAALRRAAQTNTVATSTVGMRGNLNLKAGAATLQVHGSVGIRHAAGDLSARSRYAFDGGESFTIARRPVGQSSLALAAGMTVQPTAVTQIALNYNGDFANRGRRQQSINAEMRWRF